MLDRYATAFGAPLRTGVEVTSLDPAPAGTATGARYVATTTDGPIASTNVVIATGWFRTPRIPAWAADVAPSVHLLNATEYRNPESLPAGGVLVVGSAQTGCQITEDLRLAGREVWLSTGKVGRIPRRYRGKDGFRWWQSLGGYELTEAQLPDPRGRFGPNPHVSGARGGHTINLHRFARDGVHLLGHVTGVGDGSGGTRLTIAPDLHENLGRADFVAADFKQEVDKAIAEHGWDAPPADPSNSDDHDGQEGFAVDPVESLDLEAEGIRTILWATGYLPDHRWIHLPIFDEAGHPKHEGGVTDLPGVAFVGLRYQRWLKSDLFYGVGDDAGHVVERLTATIPA
jgi:putative flavoprotein involved in K+ transport